MRKMLADNAGVTAAGSTNADSIAQKIHCLAELLGINMCFHFTDAGLLDIIGCIYGIQGLRFH
jgi:hypothetical protein